MCPVPKPIFFPVYFTSSHFSESVLLGSFCMQETNNLVGKINNKNSQEYLRIGKENSSVVHQVRIVIVQRVQRFISDWKIRGCFIADEGVQQILEQDRVWIGREPRAPPSKVSEGVAILAVESKRSILMRDDGLEGEGRMHRTDRTWREGTYLEKFQAKTCSLKRNGKSPFVMCIILGLFSIC